MKNLLINRALAAKKKKIFTFFLALVASVGTMFAEKVKIGDLYYNLDATNKTAEVTYRSYSNRTYNEGWNVTTADIPSSVKYNSVTYSVTSIGGSAFAECTGLTSVTIPNSVTSIGNRAFHKCSKLTSVTIGNSVTSIGFDAFMSCNNLTSVTIPNSVTSIGYNAFSGCTALTSVTIGNSVTSIGNDAFNGCSSLTSITIPESVTSIGSSAFRNCTGLTSPVYNAHVFAFMPTSYSGAYTIPDGIESIAGGAFKNCSGLTSVTIPNSVTSIGGWAFSGCSGLTSVTIPNSVTSISDYAFSNCTGLTSVTIEAETPPVLSNFDVFYNTNNCPIYVPCNATYKTAAQWKSYAERIYGNNCESSITVRLDPSSCSDWSTVRLWAWTDSGDLFNSWPGQVVDKDMGGWYYYTFDGDITSVNIIWNNGTDQTVNINEVTSSTCYALNSTTGTTITASVVNCPNEVSTQYTIVFKNWDGSVLQSKQVEKGKMPQYTGATPTKPSDSKYSYTFSGWTPQIVAATADATYTATFKSIGDHNITVRLDPSSCSSWSTVRLWAWTDAGDVFDSWPGQIISTDNYGWYSYTFDASITSISIIWTNGTDKTIDIRGVTSSTCYALNSTTDTTITVRVVDCVTGQTLGHADETTTTAVTATPNEDNSVTLTWPAVNGADTYTIEIKKNGVLVCTLVFNANGQLISINFAAPARDGKGRNVPAAELSANGWTYVVTGLEGNASYTYSVTAKDVNGNVLLKQSVDFSTGVAQGIEDVQGNNVQCTKVVRNGQIFILRGDKTYTLQGQEVK